MNDRPPRAYSISRNSAREFNCRERKDRRERRVREKIPILFVFYAFFVVNSEAFMKSRKYNFGLSASLVLVALFACICFLPANLSAQAPFYQGKTITIVQGREPGALGDNRVRALIPFLRKYIPGNPAIVSEFMPGAGGRKATNHIFSVTRPDGLTIGNVGAGLVANAVLGEPGVQYDLEKLAYLGSPNSATHYVFLSKKELGLNSLEKLRAYSGLRVGGQTVGHDIYINARLFTWIWDSKSRSSLLAMGEQSSI
jgi:hypothetical protein